MLTDLQRTPLGELAAGLKVDPIWAAAALEVVGAYLQALCKKKEEEGRLSSKLKALEKELKATAELLEVPPGPEAVADISKLWASAIADMKAA